MEATQLLNEFQRLGWKTRPVDQKYLVHMIYKPNVNEYCYFLVSANNGWRLLPEQNSPSYEEAFNILELVTNGNRQ